MTNLASLNYYGPELILTGTILLLVILALVYRREKSTALGYWLLAGLVAAGVTIIINYSIVPSSLFLGMVAHDGFGDFFKLLILIGTVFTVLVSRSEKVLADRNMGEFYILLAIQALGLFLMVSATDLITVYLGIEVVSITSFVLAGYLRGDLHSTEAALKYVIYGAFSSGIMLFGLSLIYGLTGETNLSNIAAALAEVADSADLALILAAVFILAGFGYKISAVPFHFWTPDVYEGAPTSITAHLSVAPKAAGFAIIIRFFNSLFGADPFTGAQWLSQVAIPWDQVLAVLAVFTMTLGNFVALRQTSVKRMLAYSSIAHAGYMMIGLPLLSQTGIFAIMVYAVFYLLMNLGAFYVVINVSNSTELETFDGYKGLGYTKPVLGIVMTIFMFSLTGIPPTAGFIGKFYLFAAVIKAGPDWYWLAIIGVLNSVISLYYYMRVVKVMYLDEKGEANQAIATTGATWLTVILAVPALVFGVYWTPVLDWITNSLKIFSRLM